MKLVLFMSESKTFFERWFPGMNAYNIELKMLGNAMKQFCFQFYKNERNNPLMFVAGESGIGKTKCAVGVKAYCRAVAMPAWEAGYWKQSSLPEVCFVRWADYISNVNQGLERDMRQSDVAIIDDVGSEADRFKNDFPIDKFCQILSAREGRFTFITSNLFQEQWAEKDSRIGDRLLRGSHIVELRETKSWSEAQNAL